MKTAQWILDARKAKGQKVKGERRAQELTSLADDPQLARSRAKALKRSQRATEARKAR